MAQTLALLESARAHYARFEKRIAREQQGLTAVRRRIEGLQCALDAYLEEKRLPRSAVPQLAAHPGGPGLAKYQGLKSRELLRAWAEDHDGVVIVNDAVQASVAVGNFDTTRRAAGNLYATIQRMAAAGDFIKDPDRRGVYHLPDGGAVADDDLSWLNDLNTVSASPANGQNHGPKAKAHTEYDDLEDLPF